MMHLSFDHRPTMRLWKEARLCLNSFSPGTAPGEGMLSDVFAWARARAIDVGNLPSNVVGALRHSFGENPERELLQKLHQSVDFLQRGAPPHLSQLIQERIIAMRLPKEKIMGLTTHQAWLEAFNQTNLSGGAHPAGPVLNEATTMLRSLDVATRQRVYSDFVSTAIHPAVISGNADIFGSDPESFAKMRLANKDTIAKAMRFMFGIETPPNDTDQEVLIASQSLIRRYFETNDGTMPGDRPRRVALREDYFHALRATGNLYLTREQLLNVLPPGYFKGALLMNIVTNEDLTAMNMPGGEMDQFNRNFSTALATHARRINDYMGVTKLEAAQMSEDLSSRFKNMPLMAKILLLFGLYKGAKTMPGPAMGIGAVMFGMYLFGGKKHPIDDAGRMISSVFGMAMGPFAGLASSMGIEGGAQRITTVEINRRAETLARFLSEKTRTSMEAVTPLGVLADIPTNMLLSYFDPATGVFKFDDPGFSKMARERLRALGLRPNAVARAFDNSMPEGQANRREFQQALENICYVIASQDPAHALQVQRVEQARLSLSASSRGIADLPTEFFDPVMNANFNPREEYTRLVSLGYGQGGRIGATLGDYIYGIMGVPTQREEVASKTAKQSAENFEKRLLQNAELIRNYVGVDGAQFDVEIRPGDVRVFVRRPGSSVIIRPISFTRDRIANFANTAEIDTEWHTKVLDQIKREMNGEMIGPINIGSFVVNLDGTNVKYYAATLSIGGLAPSSTDANAANRVATTPFLSFAEYVAPNPNNTLALRYRHWYQQPPGRPESPLALPPL